MKAFLIKYKGRILYLLVFLAIFFYFAPRQSDYYLDRDISDFRVNYLSPVLIWTGVVLCIAMLLMLLIKTKSIRKSLLPFLSTAVYVAFLLFIFRDFFLAGSLFINRQYTRENVQRTYVVKYLAGTLQIKESFIPYDVSAGQISRNNKLVNQLYHPGLKQGDTLTLRLNKGLFGIAFHSSPFNDK